MNRIDDLCYDRVFQLKYDHPVNLGFNRKAVDNLRSYAFATDIWNIIRK